MSSQIPGNQRIWKFKLATSVDIYGIVNLERPTKRLEFTQELKKVLPDAKEHTYHHATVDVQVESGQSGQRRHAIELPCAIAPLVSLYEGSGLLECKTEEHQTKWHADSKLAKVTFHFEIQTHLEDFSLCEVHYNQLVISDFLRRILSDSNYGQISKTRQNKQKQIYLEHADIKNNTCEIGIQTDNKETSEIELRVLFEDSVKEEDLDNKNKSDPDDNRISEIQPTFDIEKENLRIK
ncbi:3912_t:CDS:2 [Gigaspora margarita]|uniref:3912_t:CDS:1 n=1 Tax=Gigaspora margarita TaxID=4874 RepID=A0ABN7UKI1_GIGMA|nr:3912_t:CDS:2 [Gigaspora margarita]